MKAGEQLRRQFTQRFGRIAGGDTDEAIRVWLGGREPAEVITACVMDLPLGLREEFLEAWADDWHMVVVAHDRHPELMPIAEWATGQEGLLLLATKSGPTPPAVFLLTEGPGPAPKVPVA